MISFALLAYPVLQSEVIVEGLRLAFICLMPVLPHDCVPNDTKATEKNEVSTSLDRNEMREVFTEHPKVQDWEHNTVADWHRFCSYRRTMK